MSTSLSILPCHCGGSCLMAMEVVKSGSPLGVFSTGYQRLVPVLHLGPGEPGQRPDHIRRAWAAVEAKRGMR